MNDETEASDGGPPDERRTPTLPSARDRSGSEGGAASSPGKGRGRRGRRRGRRSKPPPARVLADAPGSAAEPVEEPTATVEIDGETWTVRVIGRASGGHRGAGAPLLLLGFWEPGAEGEAHARETLVVGRALSGFSEAELCEAHGRSGPRGAAGRDPVGSGGGRRRR